jgi:hypothetical protein
MFSVTSMFSEPLLAQDEILNGFFEKFFALTFLGLPSARIIA